MVIFTRQSAAIDTTSTNPPPQTQNIFEFIVTVVVNTSVGVESKARVGASRHRRWWHACWMLNHRHTPSIRQHGGRQIGLTSRVPLAVRDYKQSSCGNEPMVGTDVGARPVEEVNEHYVGGARPSGPSEMNTEYPPSPPARCSGPSDMNRE
jgi:hypothetical protein